MFFSVAYSPDGNKLVTGNSDTLLHVWDPSSGRQLETLAGHTKAVHAVAFSPDGLLLASGSADQKVRLWDVESGNERGTFTGHTDEVSAVEFSPDGETIVSGGKDGGHQVLGLAKRTRGRNPKRAQGTSMGSRFLS